MHLPLLDQLPDFGFRHAELLRQLLDDRDAAAGELVDVLHEEPTLHAGLPVNLRDLANGLSDASRDVAQPSQRRDEITGRDAECKQASSGRGDLGKLEGSFGREGLQILHHGSSSGCRFQKRPESDFDLLHVGGHLHGRNAESGEAGHRCRYGFREILGEGDCLRAEGLSHYAVGAVDLRPKLGRIHSNRYIKASNRFREAHYNFLPKRLSNSRFRRSCASRGVSFVSFRSSRSGKRSSTVTGSFCGLMPLISCATVQAVRRISMRWCCSIPSMAARYSPGVMRPKSHGSRCRIPYAVGSASCTHSRKEVRRFPEKGRRRPWRQMGGSGQTRESRR
ncbi:MAG: hypothetical protein BWY66_00287 [bacterium ADurb.Bin374]|nr:MAG: hypothetical protein BWY66_00287 [bacterium ADurb.Bin374]